MMRLCVFEDSGAEDLEPIALSRPVFDLWCGAATTLLRHRYYTQAEEVGVLVRPFLADLCRLQHPELFVNDLAWLRSAATLLCNARWLPPLERKEDLKTPHVGCVGDEVAYAVLPCELLTYCSANTIEDCIQTWKQRLPIRPAGGLMVRYPWHLIEANAQMLRQDCARSLVREGLLAPPEGVTILGPRDLLRVHPTARIEPYVVVDTTRGPVLVDQHAVIQAFSRLAGPCYIGAEVQVLGGQVRGSSLGPGCRVGGEVEESIFQGFVNKYHEGFVGHSYIGAWVNLAAGVQVGDLRHDYQPLRVSVAGQERDTGMMKLGSILGDHTQVGLNASLNPGTVAGVFCGLLPAGGYLPRTIPSFCAVWNGLLIEQPSLAQLWNTASIMMSRRGREWTATHAALYRALHERTAAHRRQVLRQREQRYLRLSA
jgi:UDP-N-acetylglucosamine diphosphorylase/glucosamine-1-phosphate N-acetyltransferase